MHSKHIATMTVAYVVLIAGDTLAQGALVPPGAPTPGMKTLGQVEPRMPISSMPYTITQSGSYYLTTNLTAGVGVSGISVSADNVTIDMMGYTLQGSGAGSGFGTYQGNAYQNLRVTNGKLVGWRGNARAGIFAEGYNNQVSCLQASQNHYGIYMGPNSIISKCSAHGNASDGIWASDGTVVSACSANENGSDGISLSYGAISRCSARWNVGNGISASGNSTIMNCSAFGNHSKGIGAGFGSKVSDCQASANWAGGISGTKSTEIRNCTSSIDFVAGIVVGTNCTVVGSTCTRNGRIAGDAAGILVTGHDNRIESNHVVDNDRGLDIAATGNYVIDNTVKGNGDNYDIAQGNQLNILLCEVPERIDWPASVKFSGTLECTNTSTHAIFVNAPDVMVDLEGHSLIGPGSGPVSGFYITASGDRASIRNGGISGFENGIQTFLIQEASRLHLERLAVSGCTRHGIFAGVSSRIVDCHVSSNIGIGIFASSGSSLSACTAYNNQGSDGICANASSLSACTAYDNQCDTAIYADSGSSLSDCTVYKNQGYHGILAVESTLEACTAYDNQCDAGIHAYASRMSGCAAHNNSGHGSSSYGIYAEEGALVSGCSAYSNSNTNRPFSANQGVGIGAVGSSVINCTAFNNQGDGIYAGGATTVSGNTCNDNGAGSFEGAGIHAFASANRIEGNAVSDNDRGIDVDHGGNLVVRNSARGNGTNYTVHADNDYTIQSSPIGAGAWDNFDF